MNKQLTGYTIRQVREGRIRVTYASASLTLHRISDEHWVLEDLRSEVRRKGHANGVMTAACLWADSELVTLTLKVVSTGGPRGMDNLRLYMFYRKFGFVADRTERYSHTVMRRNP